MEFQSLFFWMIPIKVLIRAGIPGEHEFQSLFFWMIPIKKTKTLKYVSDVKFQSLFFWMIMVLPIVKTKISRN